MGVGKKYRGKLDRVLENYVKDRLDMYPDIDCGRLFITHSGIDEEYIERVKKNGPGKNDLPGDFYHPGQLHHILPLRPQYPGGSCL